MRRAWRRFCVIKGDGYELIYIIQSKNNFLSIRPFSFFLRLASSHWPTFFAITSPPPKKKELDVAFWTLIASFNMNNEHRNSISRHRSFSGVSFLLFTMSSTTYFPPHWVCVDLVTMSCCFQGLQHWCWGFGPPFLRGFVLYYALTLNEKKKGGEWDYYDTQILLYQYREGRECMISITGINNKRRL